MGDACGDPFRPMPKIELHAHLSGSISRQCLHQIWLRKPAFLTGDGVSALRDPLLEMPDNHQSYDLNTFFPLFSSYIYELVNDVESITYSTNSVLQAFQDDGVIYLELRTTPRAIPSAGITQEAYIKLVLSCITAFNSTSPTLQTNLILSIDRRNSPSQAHSVVTLALSLRSQGHPIVGIDLCGDPTAGDTSLFHAAFQHARAHALPSTIHFAETSPPATEDELRVLLSYGPSRLGHVIYVPDDIKALIIERKLALELCLSCNVRAGMLPGGSAASYIQHHFAYWRDKGCPIAMCTDDVGVFGSPLSEEYALLAEHFGLVGGEVRALAREAIECIFGGEEAKDRLRRLMWV